MKILFICEPASPHAARWINQFANAGFDLHICSEDLASQSICPDLRCGTVYLPEHTAIPAGVNLVTTQADNLTKQVEMIAYLIDFIKPDLIHTLGMYINSYNIRCRITMALRQNIASFRAIPWVYSSWGMDLDWFAKIDTQRELLSQAVTQIDYHISEGDRDIKILQELGFKGKTLGKLPAFGGTTWDTTSLPQLEDRKTLLIKARAVEDGDAIGQAFKVFPALLANIDLLKNFRIIAMQAGPRFKETANQLASQYNLKIECPGRLTLQSEVLDYFRKARIWIALTTNDGLPSSLVEAMSLGAVPIHSRLSSIQEWFIEGKHGLLVDLEHSAELASILRRSLSEDGLVREISAYNQQYVKEHWSEEVVKPKALQMYNQVLSERAS